MDLKKTGYLLAILLFLIGVIVFYFPDSPTAANTAINQTEKHNTQPMESHASHTQERIDKAATAIITDNLHSELTQDDVLEFVTWQHQHGYPLLDQHGELLPTGYENYPEETLNTLADQGDARAMLILATKHMLRANFNAAEKYFLDASIRGYTVSLGTLAGIKFVQAKRNTQINNTAMSSEEIESAFAWLEVGLMRGDKALLFNKSTYELTYPHDETTRQRIIAKAEVYYEQLNQQRIQLGLGEFDNTYPKAMDVIFSQWDSNAPKHGENHDQSNK